MPTPSAPQTPRTPSAPRTVAVTGATGFVGRHVVRELLARGHRVRALVRDGDKAGRVFGADAARIDLTLGDACDDGPVSRLVRGADACIHLIGIIREVRGGRVGGGDDRPQTFQRMHIAATRTLVDACRAAGVKRFLHMSSLGAAPDSRAEYQRSKWEAERYVRRAFPDGSALDWTIFRPSIIHGPDGDFVQMMHDLCTGDVAPFFFLPYFARKKIDDSVPAGRIDFVAPSIQPIAVEDVAYAFAEALDRPQTIGEIYNLVGPDVLTWPEMLEFFRDTLPGTKKGLSTFHIPGDHAAIIAQVASVLGLGSLLPFDRGQALMGMDDSTADPAKAAIHLGLTPRPFRQTVQSYAAMV
jgi:NADH dehydrogenase